MDSSAQIRRFVTSEVRHRQEDPADVAPVCTLTPRAGQEASWCLSKSTASMPLPLLSPGSPNMHLSSDAPCPPTCPADEAAAPAAHLPHPGLCWRSNPAPPAASSTRAEHDSLPISSHVLHMCVPVGRREGWGSHRVEWGHLCVRCSLCFAKGRPLPKLGTGLAPCSIVSSFSGPDCNIIL